MFFYEPLALELVSVVLWLYVFMIAFKPFAPRAWKRREIDLWTCGRCSHELLPAFKFFKPLPPNILWTYSLFPWISRIYSGSERLKVACIRITAVRPINKNTIFLWKIFLLVLDRNCVIIPSYNRVWIPMVKCSAYLHCICGPNVSHINIYQIWSTK